MYETLKTSSSTRLLVLSPGAFDEPIRCTLKEVDLGDFPEYDAISYTWGEDTGARCMIYINNHPSLIRPNLFRALRRIRSSDEALNLWIDALSIAQDDLEEKAQQVIMIGRIFRQATCVRAWLGEQAEHSLSETMLQDIRDAVANRAKLTAPSLLWAALSADVLVLAALLICVFVRARSGSINGLLILELTTLSFTGWVVSHQLHSRKALRKTPAWAALLKRAYWSRTWIIQELVLAKKIILHCGDEISDWDALTAFPFGGDYPKYQWLPTGPQRVSFMYERHQSKKGHDPIFRIVDLRNTANPANWNQRSKSLFTLIYETRDTACADQRDRVYSLLSIDFQQQTDEQHINPDYNKTVPELYVEVLNKRFSDVQENSPRSALAELAIGLNLEATQMSEILQLLEGNHHHKEVELSFKMHQSYNHQV